MKKRLIFLLVGIVGLLTIFLYFFCKNMKEIRNISLSWTTQEYLLNDDRYCTYIYYPQLSGIEDAEKEEWVNLLIEEDVKKILERDDPDDEWRFFAVLHYQIKYINDRIISILYEGCDGPMLPGRGNPDVAMATTIDIEEERILTLEDIVADYEELNTLLLEDQFYNITLWEGTAGQYKISKEYKGKEDSLLEELKGDDNDIEWYVDDGNFVIVSFVGGPDYNEYSIEIKAIKDILQEEFLEKIGVRR